MKRWYSNLHKWWNDESRNEWIWKNAWTRQIQDAIADRRLEDGLVQDMSDSLEDGSLSSTECAQFLIDWESKRPQLVEQRLLIDLYKLLKVCTIEKARELLNSLASDPDFKDRESRNKQFARLCQVMAAILQDPSEGQGEGCDDPFSSLVTTVREARSITNSLGDPLIGIAGADELYAFYDRADRFCNVLRRAQPGSRNVFIAAREQVSSQIKLDPVEAAQQWLDRFAVDETRKDAKSFAPALFHFYVRQAERVLAEEEFGGTAVEHRLCSRLVLEAEMACLRLVPGSDPIAWLDVETDRPVYRLANLGGGPGLAIPVKISNETNGSELLEMVAIGPFDEYSTGLGLPDLQPGGNVVSINIRKPGRDGDDPNTGRLCVPDSDGDMPSALDRLRYRHKYDPDPKFQKWVIEPGWWHEVIKSLDDKGGVKIVYGLPRVGKTTGLMHIREKLIEQTSLNGTGRVPVYVNLETLLPGDDAGRDLSRLQRDILEDIEGLLVDRLHWREKKQSFGGEKLASPQAAMKTFARYFEQLPKDLSDHPSSKLLLLVDEWSVLWKLHPELAQQVVALFAPMTRTRPLVESVYCATGLIDRQLVNDYALVSETDFSLIAAAPFKADKVTEVLADWLCPVGIDDDLAIWLIANYTGGHPLLLQVFAQHMIDALNTQALTLPISWQDIERMWKPLLSESADVQRDDDFSRFRIDMYGALETIWLGLSDLNEGTNDRQKLKCVLEGESWAHLQQMLDCGLLQLDEQQHPKLGIGALGPWYQRWISGRQ